MVLWPLAAAGALTACCPVVSTELLLLLLVLSAVAEVEGAAESPLLRIDWNLGACCADWLELLVALAAVAGETICCCCCWATGFDLVLVEGRPACCEPAALGCCWLEPPVDVLGR